MNQEEENDSTLNRPFEPEQRFFSLPLLGRTAHATSCCRADGIVCCVDVQLEERMNPFAHSFD